MDRRKTYYIDKELQHFIKVESAKRRTTESALIEFLITQLKLEVEGKDYENNRN
jgi:hypothetical protein